MKPFYKITQLRRIVSEASGLCFLCLHMKSKWINNNYTVFRIKNFLWINTICSETLVLKKGQGRLSFDKPKMPK